MILYKGFSTISGTANYRLTDFDLVKQDLINHFNIRKGEKLMQPDFGTIIWSMLFEPLTEALRQAIIDDVKTIVNYDPRLGVNNIIVTEKDYGLQIEIELLYLQTNQADVLRVQFDKNSNSLTTATA